ncbi:MAG: phage tail tape measure protein [bacterium]
MANAISVGDLIAYLKLDKGGYSQGMKTAAEEATVFSSAADKMFGLVKKAAIAAFAAISAATGKAIADAARYEQQLANISTLLDKSTIKYMEQYRKQVLDISRAYGESTDTLTKGLYDILSATIPASDAITVLEQSVIAAKAGLGDAASATKAMVAVINSFGLSAAEAAPKVGDLFFEIIKRGVITMPELAEQIGDVTRLAYNAGVSLEELGATISVITRNGVDASQTMTQIRAVLNAMISPSKQAREAAADLGIDFSLSAVRAQGFAKVVADIARVAEQNPDALEKLFPNIRGLAGILNAAKDLRSEVVLFNEALSTGSVMQDAYSKQTATLQHRWDVFKETLHTVSIEVGTQLMPTLGHFLEMFSTWLTDNKDRIVGFFQRFVEILSGMAEWLRKNGSLLMVVATGFSALLIAEKVAVAVKTFSLTMTLASGPIGVITALLAAAAVAFFKYRAAMQAAQAEEKLLKDARYGLLESSEEYQKALDIERKYLVELQMEKDRLLYGYRREGYELKKAGDVYWETAKDKKNADRIWSGSKKLEEIDDMIERLEGETKAITESKSAYEAEQKAAVDALNARIKAETEAAAAAATKAAKDAAAAAEREAIETERLNRIRQIEREVANAAKTEGQIIEDEIAEYSKLGIAMDTILAYMKLKHKEYYDELTEMRDDNVQKMIESIEAENDALEQRYNAQEDFRKLQMDGYERNAYDIEMEKQRFINAGVDEVDAEKWAAKERVKAWEEYWTQVYQGELDKADNVEETNEEIANKEREFNAKRVEDWETAFGQISSAGMAVYDALREKQDQQWANEKQILQNEQKAVEKRYDAEEKAAIEAVEASALSEEKKQEEIKAIRDQYDKARDDAERDARNKLNAIALKQWKADRDAKLVSIVADTAKGVVRTFAEFGFTPWGIAAAGLMALAGAAQYKIASDAPEPVFPTYQKGGLVGANEGGVLRGSPGIDTNVIRASTGEFIMPSEQTAANIGLLEAIRSGGGAGQGLTITPGEVVLSLDGREIARAQIPFLTEESDRGTFRVAPRAVRART